MSADGDKLDCDAVAKRQRGLLDSLQKFTLNYKKDSVSRKTQSYFNKRIEKIQLLCTEFRNNDRLLALNGLPQDASYYKKDIAETFEEVYLESICLVEEERDKIFPPQLPEENSATPNHSMALGSKQPRLGKIQVPTFDGKYTEWPHFRDIYHSLVHKNMDLSLVEKFWYLKSCLKSEPCDMVKHMSITENNYESAWALLCNHYENPRELFRAQMLLFSGQSKIEREDPHAIRVLLNVSRECRQAFKNFNLALDHCDPILIFFITQKLPPQTIGLWETKVGNSNTLDKFSDLEAFLDTRIRTLEAIAESKSYLPSSSSKSKFNQKSLRSYHVSANRSKGSETVFNNNSTKCCVCNGNHFVRKCSNFLALSANARRKALENQHVCFNCLSPNHIMSACSSQRNCHCGERHHTLLHMNVNVPNEAQASSSASHRTQTYLTRQTENHILLSTAIVNVTNSRGDLVQLRALIDTGSEGSLISERVANMLNLPFEPLNSVITGVGEISVDSCNRIIHLTVKSTLNDFKIEVPVFVLKKLSGILPSKTLANTEWSHLSGLSLADPKFFIPAKIDLLLGAEVYSEIIIEGLRKSKGFPVAQNTELGWIVIGAMKSSANFKLPSRTMVTKVEVDRLLQKFWEIESVSELREFTPEEKWCEQFFSETYEHTSSGRYLVRFPFKTYSDETQNIGKSRLMAINQFIQLERKFQKNSELHLAYSEAFHEYISCNRVELVKTSEQELTTYQNGSISVCCCYLPHHAIYKASSSTTKLRIVFDASRKTSNGKSLNDILFPGPKLHCDLRSVITNWRFHHIAFTADLQQMFLQILMHHDDAQFQRVVWRDHPSDPIKEYFLNTVTFGTRSAPYHANKTIQQLAHDFQTRYPLAYPFLQNCIYVDDIFGGADTITEALNVQRQLINIFLEGKFRLRKWVSNSDEILQPVPPEDREIQLPLSLNCEDSVKTLGIFWQPFDDIIKFQFNFDLFPASNQPLTKRMVLSTIARLHDPLGLISPVILRAKLLMRKLWIDRLDWDDSVSEQFSEQWQDFICDIRLLPQLKIPRWFSTKSDSQSFELHGFCDSSKDAYAAAIYLRSIDSQGSIQCYLVTSTTRPAPIKPISIPCLELLGAEKLSKMIEKFQFEWKVTSRPKVYAWTDSEIVLHWLNGDPHRWETFVANRVTKITNIVSSSHWRHVPSEQNPADIASRGCNVADLQFCSQWWSGPNFLKKDPHYWPEQVRISLNLNDLLLNKVQIHHSQEVLPETLQLLEHFSTCTKLLRTTALIQLIAQKARGHLACLPLTVKNVEKARDFWIRTIQHHFFQKEITALEAQTTTSSKSPIANLNPFMDDNGVMRVRGRLENSSLSFDEKFPIILPSSGHFTKLLILEYHRLTLHGGAQVTLTWLRRKFWIIRARKSVRSIISKCMTCFRIRAKTSAQRMGTLPSPRVNPSFVFSTSGVDFAGPIDVKASKCRGKTTFKGYITIFVCFSTRSIHLELVGDLTTPTFLAALKRFLARRNMCSNIYSDHGRTFIGATNQLQSQEKVWRQQIEAHILPYLVNRSITWHFIPPRSPNFGGLWEAGVKSVKFHLNRICKARSYTYEEWSTLLVEIEGILNSRPLCPFTADPDDLTAITPNHFLNGDISRDLPEPDVECSPGAMSARLSELVKLKQSFWKRWSAEYLNQLQSRPKWLQPTDNLNINDLVLIKNENLPPKNWLMGRVTEIHPGNDGLVRVVTLRTSHGLIKRSITKLCRLPIDQSE